MAVWLVLVSLARNCTRGSLIQGIRTVLTGSLSRECFWLGFLKKQGLCEHPLSASVFVTSEPEPTLTKE